jgi:hypothetical protein
MKLGNVTKLFNIFLATLLLFMVVAVGTNNKAYAQTPPEEPVPQTPEQCMGAALAEYMNAITAAKGAGQIPSNIKLLSPAFNMTSYTFPGIVAGMRDAGADFSKVDGIAGNVYNVGGQSISHYMENVRATFPGAHFIITETGTFDHSNRGIIDLQAELKKLSDSGDITSALLFNGLGTNNGWRQHAFTEDQIRMLCGGDCAGKKIGINTANMFGFSSESYYQQAGGLHMSTSLEIADSGHVDNTIKGIQRSIDNGIRPIIRIGIGGSSGGFKDPATYAAFLAEIGNRFPGAEIYAIAGPNEPDLENWLAPECSLFESIPGAISQCAGPILTDMTYYRGQVIGHQDPSPDGLGPWKIYASATDEKEDAGDIVSAVVVERMVIAPTTYWSTDFSTLTQKYIGSLAPVSDDFIENKVASQFRMDEHVPRSVPIYMSAHIPGYIYQGGLEISAQPEKKGETETYKAFQARVYPSQDGLKPGKKSTIDNFSFDKAFVGCLQASVCDPSTGEECLKNDKSGEKCGAGDSAENCIGLGHIIKFQMTAEDQMKLLEPADRQPMDKVLWDFSTAVVRKPGDTIPPGRQAILATSLEDYYAQEQQLLAKQNEKDMAEVIPKNLTDSNTKKEVKTSSTIDNANPISPKKAQAQGSPPYQANQPYCDGANILIENKTAENQFSVKAWKATDGCPGGSDWGYDIQYYVVNQTGESRHIGGCNSPIHRSAEFPEYRAGSGDDEEYGVPLETLQGCSIPITPRDLKPGEELQVSFHQLGGRAPYKDGCNQHFYCECPSESACGIKDDSPPPPVDCTKCETWAPSGECATMDAEDLLEVNESPGCDKGQCQIGNQTFRLAEDIEDDTKSVSVGDLFSDFLKSLYSAGAKLFNYHCESSEDCVSRDPATGACLDHEEKWECTFGERQYLLYGYVPSRFLGRLNENRTNYDYQVFPAIYKVPGVSDSYFDPKPSKHELAFKLSLGGSLQGVSGNGNTDADCGSNFLSTTLGGLFPGLTGPAKCIDLEISGGDTRSMYIEYTDHYSQAAQYCLSEAAGSFPTDFPTRAIDFCEPFLSSLRNGGNFLSGASSDTQLSSGTIKQIEEGSLNTGVPARLIATILAIESGNLNSCTRNNSTATGPFQITDLTMSDTNIISSDEKTAWNIKDWAPGTPQSLYREDGRCDPKIAPVLAARVLKNKAGVDARTGTIPDSDFEKIKRAFGGYFGTCSPTDETQRRWGTGISYCDKGLYEMGLRQYCTNGQLSPNCDNSGSTTMDTTIKTKDIAQKTVMQPVITKTDPKVIQAQLAAELERLLDKYSKNGSFDMNTPIDQMPKGFKEEVENLQRTYKEKYNL